LTSGLFSGKKYIMSRWTIKSSTLLILSFVIAVMLLIVVLPDVDLLDTAFHRDTAPIVIHARATSAPVVAMVHGAFQLSRAPGRAVPHSRELNNYAALSPPNFLPILFRSIRR
jgi:hypothetical protein